MMGTILKFLGLIGTTAFILREIILANMDKFNEVVEFGEVNFDKGLAELKMNPIPVIVAFTTFALTVVYHKFKGKSFRESVEVAATRVEVINVPIPQSVATGVDSSPPAVQRAQARVLERQLEEDLQDLQERKEDLPADLTEGESELFKAKVALIDAEAAFEKAKHDHQHWADTLDDLREEIRTVDQDIVSVRSQLKTLGKKT